MTNLPEGFSFDAFKIEVDGTRATIVCGALLNWTQSLAEPVTYPDGNQRFEVGIAIPKNAEKLVAAIRDAEKQITTAAGVKGAFPSAFRDGAAKDGSGMYAKAKGRLEDFYYATLKTKRAPRLVEKGTSGWIEVEASEVKSGGFAVVSFDLIVIGHGSDSKKGTSGWLNRLAWMSGGDQISGGGGAGADDDLDIMAGGAGDAGAEFF